MLKREGEKGHIKTRPYTPRSYALRLFFHLQASKGLYHRAEEVDDMEDSQVDQEIRELGWDPDQIWRDFPGRDSLWPN